MTEEEIITIVNTNEISPQYVRSENGADFGGGNVTIYSNGQLQSNKGVLLPPIDPSEVAPGAIFRDTEGRLCVKDMNGEVAFLTSS